MKHRVLSVGQCGYDNSNLRNFFAREFNADLTAVDDSSELKAEIDRAQYDLILVNRIFDHTRESGLSVIADVAQNNESLKIMLVSNYEQYQQEAVAAGALPGFGKAELDLPATREKIEAALGAK